MSSVHITGDKAPIVLGDVVGGDKITTIIGAVDHVPVTLIEKAEELILDAQNLAFNQSVALLKALKTVKHAKKKGTPDDVKIALDSLETLSGSETILVIIQELRKQ